MQPYRYRTQQEILLIKHSDIFYIMPSGSPAILNSRTSNTISLLKLEVGTNQSHNVCAWRVWTWAHKPMTVAVDVYVL